MTNYKRDAVLDSEKLLGMLEKGWLGKGWTTNVWYSVEWHYGASYKNTGLLVFPTTNGQYHACINYRFPSGSWDNPRDAVNETMQQLSDKITDLMIIHHEITGSWFD